MDINNIKDIWKKGVETNIDPYSEEEVNEIVVKSAKKSIRTVYPGTVFRLVVVAVIVFIIAKLFVREQSMEWMLDISALIVLSVSYFIWERSAYKMQKYTNDKSVKEWLESRIKKMEKDIAFNVKYDLVIYACSFLSAIGFYVLYQITANTTPNIWTVIFIPIGVVIYLLIVRRSINRNYQKVLRELKELYKQFEESNE